MVHLDSLRDRLDDLAPLWEHFVAGLGQGTTVELSGAAFEMMALHAWPFNVRELRQLVRRALLLRPGGRQVSVDDLPEAMRSPPLGAAAPVVETASSSVVVLADGEAPTAGQLRKLLEEFGGNVKCVAAFLGKDRKQIYRWLRREHIDPDAYRRSDP